MLKFNLNKKKQIFILWFKDSTIYVSCMFLFLLNEIELSQHSNTTQRFMNEFTFLFNFFYFKHSLFSFNCIYIILVGTFEILYATYMPLS